MGAPPGPYLSDSSFGGRKVLHGRALDAARERNVIEMTQQRVRTPQSSLFLSLEVPNPTPLHT